MVSISANGSKGHHKFTLTVTETSTSIKNNESTVSYSFKLSPITKGYDWDWKSKTISYTVKINGTSYTGTIPKYDGSSTVTLKSGIQTVGHDANGAKTIDFSFDVIDGIGATYTSGNAKANGTMALTTLESTTPSTGAAPQITFSVEDANSDTFALTGDSSKLIRYYSNAKATMSAKPQGGATSIKKYTIKNGSLTASKSTYTFNSVESNTFTFSAEDDKGYVGTKTHTADIVNYIRLTCSVANGAPDANGDMYLSCGGDYFNGSFGAKDNSLTVQYSYSGSDESYGSGEMRVTTSGNTYSASVWLEGLKYQATYTFTITATDELETVTSTKSAVQTKPLFHWGANDFTFEVPVKFNGGISGGSTWTPYLTEDGAVVNGNYDIQKGWCQKLGNVVTIGWLIKAYINPGYHGQSLVIWGKDDSPVPLPSCSAFGGGVAHNVYIKNAGYVFEGWCIDEFGKITARTQPCNNTTGGNLEIAKNCCYPQADENDSVLVTLAGTICYMTGS